MKVKGLTVDQLSKSIETINKKHGYKIVFNRYPERIGNYLHFTIKSESSKIPGARISSSGRNLISASWHAHGYLFNEIFNINKEAIIHSGTQKITIDEGNWIDRNIGSIIYPCYFSETSIL